MGEFRISRESRPGCANGHQEKQDDDCRTWRGKLRWQLILGVGFK